MNRLARRWSRPNALALICGIASLLSFAQIANADKSGTLEWGKAGDWTIRVDTTLGNGCFALAQYTGGSAFRIGFDLKDHNVLVLFGKSSWKSIQYGKEYPVQLTFGNESPWAGNATGFSFDPPKDEPFLLLSIDAKQADELLDEFMRQLYVAARYNDKEIMRLSLKGSYKAGMQLLKCQEAIQKSSADPFRTTPSTGDPFRSGPTGSTEPTTSTSQSSPKTTL